MSGLDPRELRPRSGARFVLTRLGDQAGEARVYRPRDELRFQLSWDEGGALRVDPTPTDPWTEDQLHKLARLFVRSGKPRMVRWRG